MKSNSITLRKFIETFPLKSFTKKTNHIPNNFNELSYSRKYSYAFDHVRDVVTVLKVEKDFIFFGTKDVFVTRHGNRIYIDGDHEFNAYVRITPTSIKVSKNPSAVYELLHLLGFKLINDLVNWPKQMMSKPSILRAILTKRIYNQESFYKAVGCKIFGLKQIPWRMIRDFLTDRYIGFSLIDLKYFTRNVVDSLNVINQKKNSYNSLNIYRDLLSYAIQLNEVVDFTWSDKRINFEHQRQIRKVQLAEIENKENVPIYDTIVEDENIRQLNSELDVFREAQEMSHCLYRCYYNKIKDKKYIAWHMSYPESCTFSIRSADNNDKFTFDQIYAHHDTLVQPETQRLAKEFVNNHKEDIIKALSEKPKIEVTSKTPVNWGLLEDDLAF